MQDNSYLPDCNEDDVLSLCSNNQPVMFRVSKFRSAVKNAFQEYRNVADALSDFLKSQGVQIDTGGKWIHKHFSNNNLMWFNEGIDCEMLRLGAKGWQKGKIKIRISLEFYPGQTEIEEIVTSERLENKQSESSLDDIRQLINQDN